VPELPEVETLRRSLRPHLLGARILSASLRRRDVLTTPGDPRGGFTRSRSAPRPRPRPVLPAHLLQGATISALERRGKQLAILADDGRALVVRLGMSGQVLLAEDPRRATRGLDHVHAVWRLAPRPDHGRPPATDRCLLFRDPRRFGGLAFLPSREALDDHWSALGPDALTITADLLGRRLAGRDTPIKAALLNQAILAGVGNIYADESLFEAGLHPLRRAADLDQAEVNRLAAAIRSVLRAALAAGGSTLRDYRDADGLAGTAQHAHRVYGRTGRPCPRCGLPLASRVIAQRTTTFCTTCQPLRGS
jgi:formamidopyrimidine-DNA glycosylase